ncbi:adult-specific rigid cuticular protein 15.7-like isoform X1 [Parasteatoda tepidariorum]|uniref:adult-specific rigid cuticular protein 15.7-like isoform X1 n=1 Tax=Parasteatoda tepidariorum TaxID=114398 RepID=UPI001C717F99|nr:adult-specific rigid cuticular protein 15.7-like [Parasteatoda tepidariorum]
MIAQVFLLSALATISLAHLHEPVHHAPKPYKFGYSIKDKHGEQHREESGTGGHVTGSYGFTDDRGIKRQVNYVADHAGFRAQVKTNEPGTANQNPAAVQLISDAPYTGGEGYLGVPAAAAGYGLGGQGYGYGGIGSGYGLGGLGYGYGGLGAAYGGQGYGGAYGGYGNLGYGGAYGGYGGYGLGILGGLGYARYGY